MQFHFSFLQGQSEEMQGYLRKKKMSVKVGNNFFTFLFFVEMSTMFFAVYST